MPRWTVTLVLLSCWWTILGREQSRVWQSQETLWAYTARVHPSNMLVQQNYGTALLEAKKVEETCEQLRYIQRLSQEEYVTSLDWAENVDSYVVDRLLVLAYLDYKDFEVTACRDDSVLIAASQ